MTSYEKTEHYLNELKRKHKELDTYIATQYSNTNTTADVYKLKTRKLWLKDEIARISKSLEEN